ncbi:MAG: DNA primase, partial [Halanaerobiaceae bacterium]|nr:DNA primase [Halanaerobiaceae bacterium]
MSGINGDFVERIKYSLDIVDIISEYIPLKRTGNNYTALCPFHQEKTPSFTVNPDKQFYYCFGCGSGGDLISFVMEIENISFREALKILAERAGLDLPASDISFQERDRKERELIFTINKLSAKFYHYLLMESEAGEKAVKYMADRGFDRNDLRSYYLGYAPDGWQALTNFLQKRGFTGEDILKAGLALQGKNGKLYDRFRDRIIFPIYNIRGEVIAFGGRTLKEAENTPKYLNSPETAVYKKGRNLYGINWALDEMRKTGNVVIMEGYTDVIQAHKHGINNAVASLGTAFTIEQAQLMKRYVSNVYISYDADAAGARATLRGLDILSKEGLNIRVIELPPDKDPDEFIKNEKKAGFGRLMDDAVNLMEFKIKQAAGNYDLSRIDDKITFTKKLAGLLSEINDTIERELHIQNASRKYNIELETLKKGVSIYRS